MRPSQLSKSDDGSQLILSGFGLFLSKKSERLLVRSGYALLLEDSFQRQVDKGFVYLISKNDASVFNLTRELKAETAKVLDEMGSMIGQERMPPPTPFRNRCTDCEYRNFCGDIF